MIKLIWFHMAAFATNDYNVISKDWYQNWDVHYDIEVSKILCLLFFVEIATYGYLMSFFGFTHRVPLTEVQTLDLSALVSRQGWQGGGDCDEVDFNSTITVSNSYLN